SLPLYLHAIALHGYVLSFWLGTLREDEESVFQLIGAALLKRCDPEPEVREHEYREYYLQLIPVS
ncbi:MAG: hypothetical protein ACK56F_10635, partial [bacterium]